MTTKIQIKNWFWLKKENNEDFKFKKEVQKNKRSVKMDMIGIMIKKSMNFRFFLMTGISIFFRWEIVRKCYVVKKPFILILLSNTITSFILCFKSFISLYFSCVIQSYFLFFERNPCWHFLILNSHFARRSYEIILCLLNFWISWTVFKWNLITLQSCLLALK